MKELAKNVDSSQAFTVVDFLLKLQGEFMIKNPSFGARAFQIINYFLMDIVYTIAFFLQLGYVADLQELLDTLPIQTCSVVCAIKLFMIFRSVPELIEANEIFDQLNSRPMTEDQNTRMENVNAFCRKLTRIMLTYYCSCNIIPETSAFLSHGTKLIYPVWIPYDWKATTLRFYLTLSVQFVIHMQLVIQALINDVLGPLYMNVVNSHLEVNLDRFANLNKDPTRSEEETYRELIDCIEDHRLIMRLGLFMTLFLKIMGLVLAPIVGANCYIVTEYAPLFCPEHTKLMTVDWFKTVSVLLKKYYHIHFVSMCYRAYDLIQKNVSNTISVQFVGSIISFSTWGLYYLYFSATPIDLISKGMCLIAQIIELFPFCYFSEKFSATTDRTVFALFSSNWVDSSPRFRKSLIIFMQMTQEKKVVYAGKLISVTLSTFVSAVKTMYSVMMLLASFQK